MSIEAMKQALEALKSVADHRPNDETNTAITALRQAIEQAEQAQPVKVWDAEGYDALCQQLEGWKARALKAEQANQVDDINVVDMQAQPVANCLWARNGNTPCPHTTPPRQPLTDEQIIGWVESGEYNVITNDWASHIEFVRAIEAAHGIKGEA